MGKSEVYMDKILLFANKVQNNKYLSSISQGLMSTLPILMIGSIALLLAVLPINGWQNFLESSGLGSYLLLATTLTTSLIALYASFTVPYKLAQQLNQEPIMPAIVSALCFLIVTPLANVEGTSYLDIGWLGAKGLFTALLVSIIACKLYCVLIEKKITIKMPDGVPPVVSTTFAGLLPAIIVGLLFLIVAIIFGNTSYGSFADFIYNVLSIPLQNLSSSVWSLVFLVFVQMFLWFFGIHGSLVIAPFIESLYLPMDTANMEAVMAGTANSDLPNILGKTFYNLFSGIGGAGGTLSLLILMLIFAKSKRNKALARLSILPGCFTINEPVVFGVPLILNPIMAIPFITVPLIQTIVAYLAIALGIVPKLTGVQVPFGVPVIFNAIIAGGWRVGILQVVCILVGMLIYFPFLKILDKKAYEQEQIEEKKDNE